MKCFWISEFNFNEPLDIHQFRINEVIAMINSQVNAIRVSSIFEYRFHLSPNLT